MTVKQLVRVLRHESKDFVVEPLEVHTGRRWDASPIPLLAMFQPLGPVQTAAERADGTTTGDSAGDAQGAMFGRQKVAHTLPSRRDMRRGDRRTPDVDASGRPVPQPGNASPRMAPQERGVAVRPAFGGGNQGNAAGGGVGAGAGLGDDENDDSENIAKEAEDALFERQKKQYLTPSRRDLRRGIGR